MMTSVFEHTGFRDYLRDYYQFHKTTGRFSFREFSRRAGFASPNFMKLVIDGKTRVSPASVEKIRGACGLKGREKECFRQLVRLDQARTVDEKMSALARIKHLRSNVQPASVQRDQAAFYGAWHHAAVREVISILGRADAPEIAGLMTPRLTEKQVRDSIGLLKSLRMIESDKKGACRPARDFVSSGGEVPAGAVRNYQREMGLLGVDALFTHAPEEREISGATFCMSEKSAAKLKQLIVDLRREALRLAKEDDSPQRAYRLNLQLFPLSKARRSAGAGRRNGGHLS